MARLTEYVLRHRRLVMLAWLVLFLAGAATAGAATNRLTVDFSLPGQPGYETAKQLIATYGNGGLTDPLIATVTVPPGHTVAADRQQVTAAFDAVAQVPRTRVVDQANTGDNSFVTADGRTAYALVFIPLPASFSDTLTPAVRTALTAAAPAGATVGVTGLTELSNGGDSNGPGVLVETLLGALGALAVLAFVFASFLALVPLLIAAVSILTTFLIVLGMTYLTDMSFIVQFLVALIGLGVAIDYSLLVVTRWREERDSGADSHRAIVTAMETAGHAVVFSGVTVAIGLFALVVLPVPFLRSMAYGGVLIPLVSVLVTLTLLPALLGGIGPKVDWPRIRKEAVASRGWSRWARLVVRRRWFAAGAAITLLVALMLPVLGIKVGLAASDSLAKSGPAYDALHRLEQGGVPTGVLTPMEVLTSERSADQVVSALRGVNGVTAAYAPTGSSRQDGTVVVVAIPERETSNATSVGVVHRAQNAVEGIPGVVGVTGVGAQQIDYVNAVYKNFPLALVVIIVLTFILLARAFRSLLLPLKAVLLNLVSLAATFGGMVLFWQYGHGSQALFSIPATGAITFWVPVLVFAFLYGLSMDYEVFILARVREEYDHAASTNAAVITGIGRTGRLVTSAALILFLAFASLASGPQVDVKVLATGLGFGILLDATIVRALLVPALVSLFGRWNWYLPAWLARPLRVAPSYPHPENAESRTPVAVPAD